MSSTSVFTPSSHTEHGMAKSPTPPTETSNQSRDRTPTSNSEPPVLPLNEAILTSAIPNLSHNHPPPRDDSSPTLPPNKEILASAIHMTNTTRFLHLLSHAKALITLHGPYTTVPTTSVFTRSPKPSRPTKPPFPAYPSTPTLKSLALSLASAQDSTYSTYSAQPPSSTRDDLDFFTLLWDSSVVVLEEILCRGDLPQESFGWGIYGLASGYMNPPPSSCPSRDLRQRNVFGRNKERLKDALCMMPSLEGGGMGREREYMVGMGMGMGMGMGIGSGRTTTEALTRARRDIHTLGHILLYEFRKGGWKRVRWGHAVMVAERWVGAFGVGGEEGGKEEVRRGEGKKGRGKRVTFEFP